MKSQVSDMICPQKDSPCGMGFFVLFMAQPLSICGNGKKSAKLTA
ncbi:hypothetical protein ACWIW6_00325 [Ursidibacter sp. B-7004-1]